MTRILHLGDDVTDQIARQLRLGNLIAMRNSLDRESDWAIELRAEIADEIAATRPYREEAL